MAEALAAMTPWSLAAQSSGSLRPKRRRTDKDRQRDVERVRDFAYRDAEWKRCRKQVLRRDGFICQMCGARAVLVHHEPPLSGPDDPGRTDPARCLSYCRRCHEDRHGRT